MSDPYAWVDPVAAQQKILAGISPVPAAAQTAAPSTGNVIPITKQFLDAYRAANGGQLPPGITPEQAAQLDTGLIQSVNANMASSVLQQLATMPAEFDAARNAVNTNYANLTGDVLQSGQNWMQSLYGNLFDPAAMAQTGPNADPNAALAAQDPTFTQYANNLAQIDETADTNQATDLSWFDKLQTVMAQNYNALLANPPVATGGGGGGGGGGGRGRGGGGYSRRGYGGGGYGYGGGGSDWSAPKTTDTQSVTSNEYQNLYNPGFYQDFEDVGQTPEEKETIRRLFETYGGTARDVAAGLASKDIPAVEALIEAARGQLGMKQEYMNTVPARAQNTMTKGMTTEGMIRDNLEQFKNPAVMQMGQASTVGSSRPIGEDETLTPWITKGDPEYVTESEREGLQFNLAYRLRSLFVKAAVEKGAMTPQQGKRHLMDFAKYMQQEFDRQGLKKAQDAGTNADPFTYEGWEGYVENPSQTEMNENLSDYDLKARLLAKTREWNPNIDWQTTRLSNQLTGKQSTVSTTKNPEYAVGGDPEDIPAAAYTGYKPAYSGTGPGEGMAINSSVRNPKVDALVQAAADRLHGRNDAAMEKIKPVSNLSGEMRRAGSGLLKSLAGASTIGALGGSDNHGVTGSLSPTFHKKESAPVGKSKSQKTTAKTGVTKSKPITTAAKKSKNNVLPAGPVPKGFSYGSGYAKKSGGGFTSLLKGGAPSKKSSTKKSSKKSTLSPKHHLGIKHSF